MDPRPHRGAGPTSAAGVLSTVFSVSAAPPDWTAVGASRWGADTMKRSLGHLPGNHHPDFFTVFPRGTKRESRLFELLKAAYIDARYNPDYRITRKELEYLASRVRRLQRLTKRICQAHIAGFA